MRFNKIMTALAATGMMLSFTTPVHAAKAKYKIITHKQTKSYPHSKIIFYFQQPVLQGKSAAVKKINKSLANDYKKDLKWYKKGGYERAKSLSNWYSEYSDEPGLCQMKDTAGTHVYNGKKYFSVGYHRIYDVPGQSIQDWADARTYSLKTGKKLKLTDLIKGSKKTIAKKIYKAQSKEDKRDLKFYMPNPNKMEFIVKGKKIYITRFSSGLGGLAVGYKFLNPVKIDK